MKTGLKNKIKNRLIESGTTLILEPMTYRNLARLSRAIARQDKPSDIKDKRGNSKQICKYKRRRRFGHSILIHSPSAFITQLESKALRYGDICETVNTAQYKPWVIDTLVFLSVISSVIFDIFVLLYYGRCVLCYKVPCVPLKI